jgi:hypothetical protein
MLGDASLSIHDTARIEAKLHRDGRKMVGRTIQQEWLVERTLVRVLTSEKTYGLQGRRRKHSQKTFM